MFKRIENKRINNSLETLLMIEKSRNIVETILHQNRLNEALDSPTCPRLLAQRQHPFFLSASSSSTWNSPSHSKSKRRNIETSNRTTRLFLQGSCSPSSPPLIKNPSVFSTLLILHSSRPLSLQTSKFIKLSRLTRSPLRPFASLN